jgi:hypothetical protein
MQAVMMDERALRQLIRHKLADGSLPLDGIFRAEVGVKGQAPCDACSLSIPPDQVVIQVVASSGSGARFHRDCFTIWKAEVEASH